MKCAKCGAELKKGCLYCSVCGHEAQMVNEFSVIEEDYLKSILAEGPKEKDTAAGQTGASSHPKKHPPKKEKKKKVWIPLFIAALVLIVGCISILLYIKYKNDNSYDHQMEVAQKAVTAGEYDSAVSCYQNAMALAPTDIAARMQLAELYQKMQDDDAALVLYMEVLTLDDSYEAAYQGLISIYVKEQDYEKIKDLASGVKDASVLKLFDDYLTDPPVIYPDDGTYDIYTMVTILSLEDAEIYYTTDGSDPETNGISYPNGGFELDETGTVTVKAVCKNAYGIYSDVATRTYRIVSRPPAYPTVSPNGGTVTAMTYVIISAEEDCNIYYTWDGTDPTAASDRYVQPIEVPEGNNILSVLVVNRRTGLSSQIYRTNFIYSPEASVIEDAE